MLHDYHVRSSVSHCIKNGSYSSPNLEWKLIDSIAGMSHTHTHNHFTALWMLSGTTWVSRYQKKHSPTHTYCNHQSSLICFLHLLRSVASSLFNLRAWQSFSTISLSFLWFTSWPGTLHFILHTFLDPIIVFFSQHMPIPSQPVLL